MTDMIDIMRDRIRLLRSLLPEGQVLASVTVSKEELLALMADASVMQFIDIDPLEPKALKFDGVPVMVE